MRSLKKPLIIAFILLIAKFSIAGSHSALMQTANVREPGKYELKLQGDLFFVDDVGFNLLGHFSSGIIEHYLDADFFVGTWSTDFQIGTQFKYNLLPDLPEQFGLSLLFGGTYQRDEEINFLLLGFTILASKGFETSFGSLDPYAAFQFEGRFNASTDTSRVPLSLLVGAKSTFKELKNLTFYGELGINLHESVNAIGVGVGYEF